MKKNLFFKAFLPILLLLTQSILLAAHLSGPDKMLFGSISQNNLQGVQNALNKGARLNVADSRGNTPLFAAFFKGKFDIANYLLQQYHPQLWNQATPNNNSGGYLKGGDTILHWLTKRILDQRFASNAQCIGKLVLKAPSFAQLNRNYSGQTPVHTLAGAMPEKTTTERKKSFMPQGKSDLISKDRVKDPSTALKYNQTARYLMNEIASTQNVNALDDAGRTALHFAAMNGYPQLVQTLINKGADANLTDEQGKTPLHYAAIKGFYPIIKTLLQSGAKQSVNLKDQRGRTPLHWVQRMRVGSTAYATTPYHMTQQAALEAMQLLLQAGANPTIKDNDGRNALGWAQLAEERAKKYGHPYGNYNQEIALLKKYTPKTQIFQNQQQPSMIGLTQQFGTMQLQQQPSSSSYIPSSAPAQQQQLSSSSGNWLSADQYKQQLQQTIAASQLHEKRDQQKWQPQTTTTKITTRQLTHGDKALFKAAQNNNETLAISAIFTLKANVNAQDTQNQRTPLHTAAAHNNIKVIEILINNNADIHAQDNVGNTPLHKAAEWGHQAAVNALLKAGGNRSIQNNFGQTPGDIARAINHSSLAYQLEPQQTYSSQSFFPSSTTTIASYTVDDLLNTFDNFRHDVQKANTILQGNKALANTANSSGIKPLNFIASMGSGFFNPQSQDDLLLIAKNLIQAGADINAYDTSGKTPLLEAIEMSNDKMVQLLLFHGADIDLKDKQGKGVRTALRFALDKNKQNAVGDPMNINKMLKFAIKHK